MNKIISKGSMLLAFILGITIAGCGSDEKATSSVAGKESKVLTQKVSSFLDEIKSKPFFADKPAGMVAFVLKENGEYGQGAFGLSHNNVALNTDMVFGIGSDTKTFTATLILKLVEEGKLALDDEIGKYLPSRVNSFIPSKTTITQLLKHTSGIYDPVGEEIGKILSFKAPPFYTPDKILSLVNKPVKDAGKFHYSNTNYILLGLLIEKITGQNYHNYLRKTILDPLKLEKTFLEYKEKKPENAEMAYSWMISGSESQSLKDLPRDSIGSLAWSAGALFSSVKDLATWYQSLFSAKIINEKTLDIFKKSSIQQNMGYGIVKAQYDTHITYSHTGQTIAYGSIILIDEKSKDIVILIENFYAEKSPINSTSLAVSLLKKITQI